MFPPMGAPVGFIAANGFFLLLGLFLTDDQFRDWGWRLPFLASAVLVAPGLWVRLKLPETPEFLEAAQAEALPTEIGRASCRERVCQYVWISVGGGSLKKKKSKKQRTTE